MKTNSIVVVFYDALVERTNCRNTGVFFRLSSPSLYYLHADTKHHQSFSNQQFRKHAYQKFWRNKGKYGGGLLFYLNGNIPFKVLRLNYTPECNEVVLLEFGLNAFVLVSIKHHLKIANTFLITCQKILVSWSASMKNYVHCRFQLNHW